MNVIGNLIFSQKLNLHCHLSYLHNDNTSARMWQTLWGKLFAFWDSNFEGLTYSLPRVYMQLIFWHIYSYRSINDSELLLSHLISEENKNIYLTVSKVYSRIWWYVFKHVIVSEFFVPLVLKCYYKNYKGDLLCIYF